MDEGRAGNPSATTLAGRTGSRAGGLPWWGRPWLAAVIALVLVLGVAAAGAVAPARPSPPAQRQSPLAIPGVAGGTLTSPVSASGPASAAPSAAGTSTASRIDAGAATLAASAPTAAGSARPGAVSDPGVSDTQILIGGSTFTSGPAAVYGEQIAVGFAAGVDYINAHGGINGRRVALKIYDDGGDPAKQLANTQRLVEVDKVFALTMIYAPIAGQYVLAHHIPVLQEGQFDEDFTHPYWFPLGGPQSLAAFKLANFGARTLGVKSVAIFYIDAGGATFSKAFADTVAHDWEAYGVKVPAEEAFSPGQGSCSNALSAAMGAKVDFIDFEVDAATVINCGVGAQIQGYKPPKGWGGYLIGVPVVPQALGDYSIGMYAFDAFGADYDVPGYKAAVHNVSGQTESRSSVTAANFIAALLFRDGVARLGDHITREGLRQTLNSFVDWTPGLTQDPNQPHWTFSAGCHAALKGGYIIEIKRQPDGSDGWSQITPQSLTTPVPPGVAPPAEYAACPIFSPG